MVFDYRDCGFDDAEVKLCEYAIALTLRPGDMQREDIETLRDVGFTDDQITVATQVISYFNYINRIADGLGVDSEDWMILDVADWMARKANFQTS